MNSRAPWSCGLIHHVLDWEVEGLSLATANFFGGEGGVARIYALTLLLLSEEKKEREESPHIYALAFIDGYLSVTL